MFPTTAGYLRPTQKDSSAQLRRQIGFYKKHINRQIADILTILTDYNIHPTTWDLAHLDNDDIKSLRLEIHSTKLSREVSPDAVGCAIVRGCGGISCCVDCSSRFSPMFSTVSTADE
ncbi:unnamed protein product [Nippostrongylus brasiliensis]|uniref:Transposase n=1 Tax=Nippostrongylus brasiliensis TaxID=27835 RepID=A0A0N4XWU2_NIPBR|nr:hypothetical protein Q1695_013031 [Nippostrongylus brasiliensis]VDL70983.1 unnamed protein product [Nippostrongylus brasiliensis]